MQVKKEASQSLPGLQLFDISFWFSLIAEIYSLESKKSVWYTSTDKKYVKFAGSQCSKVYVTPLGAKIAPSSNIRSLVVGWSDSVVVGICEGASERVGARER
jgi:hypothetical protein